MGARRSNDYYWRRLRWLFAHLTGDRLRQAVNRVITAAKNDGHLSLDDISQSMGRKSPLHVRQRQGKSVTKQCKDVCAVLVKYGPSHQYGGLTYPEILDYLRASGVDITTGTRAIDLRRLGLAVLLLGDGVSTTFGGPEFEQGPLSLYTTRKRKNQPAAVILLTAAGERVGQDWLASGGWP